MTSAIYGAVASLEVAPNEILRDQLAIDDLEGRSKRLAPCGVGREFFRAAVIARGFADPAVGSFVEIIGVAPVMHDLTMEGDRIAFTRGGEAGPPTTIG